MSAVPFQPPRREFSFSNTVSGFLGQPRLPFADVLTEERICRIFAKHHGLFGRTYTTAIVLWAFMSQVLRDGKGAACQSAVSRISSHLQATTGIGVSSDTRDYCRARAKLPEQALRALAGDVACGCEEGIEAKHLFKERHAKLIDGSTFIMPDTPKNQAEYPQNPTQQPGIGFPIARFVVIVSLATACVIDAAIGKYKGKETGETALLRRLLDCFAPGDIAVADRFYGNYWVIALLMARGADVCFRKHQGRLTDFRRGKRLSKNDHLVIWTRPPRPKWMSQELHHSMPKSIMLREIRYVVTEPGRRQQPFVVVTTMFNENVKQEITYEDIAQLFAFRWNAELDIRSIKTHLNLNHLRCKSPEMVRREFWTTILAYNAIRVTAARAGQLEEVAPRGISFVSTCQYVLAAWDVVVLDFLTGSALHAYCIGQLKQLTGCKVGLRPGRFEPRVRKKRDTTYRLMMQPRQKLRQRLVKGDNSFETR